MSMSFMITFVKTPQPLFVIGFQFVFILAAREGLRGGVEGPGFHHDILQKNGLRRCDSSAAHLSTCRASFPGPERLSRRFCVKMGKSSPSEAEGPSCRSGELRAEVPAPGEIFRRPSPFEFSENFRGVAQRSPGRYSGEIYKPPPPQPPVFFSGRVSAPVSSSSL